MGIIPTLTDKLTVGHLAIGLGITIIGGAFSAGTLYSGFKTELQAVKDSQADRAKTVDTMTQSFTIRAESNEKRLSRIERNIVRIADKVGATVESPQ